MEVAPGNFEGLSYRELQKVAKSQGLNAGGKKEQILKRLRQNAVAAQQKENAASVKAKHAAGSTKQPQPSGKENDTHAVPRKTRTMASSGASPRLLKKALGHISLNSPRANQRMVISSHKNKPLFSPASAVIAEPMSIKPPTAATADDSTSEAATTDAAMQTSDNSKIEEESTSTVVEETKSDDRDESTSAAAQLLAAQAGQEEGEAAVPVATDVVRGRPSMTVATANPRLQETSALPRGTVVRVRLFAEETVPEVTQEEENTAVADSAGKEEIEQQQDESGHGVVAEERPETVQLPLQEQDEKTVVVTECAQAAVSSGSVAVPSEAAAGGEQQVEAPAPLLLPEEEQDKDGQQQQQQQQQCNQQQGGGMATPAPEEVRRDASQTSAAGTAGEAMPVFQVQPAVTEGEHVLEVEETADAKTPEPETVAAVVVEEHGAGAGMGKPPSSSARLEVETTLTTAALPSQEKREEKDDQAPVSLSQQPAEAVVPAEKAREVTGQAAAAEHEVEVADECREETAAPVVMPHHAGSVVDAETRSLVEESKYLQFADDERSVLCTLTGKKVSPAFDNILLHMGSRKVQRLMVEGPFLMTDYEGMFMVEDPADDGFVFCELTGMRLFKSKAAVDQHVNSQPFKEMMALLREKLNV